MSSSSGQHWAFVVLVYLCFVLCIRVFCKIFAKYFHFYTKRKMHVPTVPKSTYLAGVKLCLGREEASNLLEVVRKVYYYIKKCILYKMLTF